MSARRLALVTGSAGFVGRHTVRELVARGYDVIGIDLVEAGPLCHPSGTVWPPAGGPLEPELAGPVVRYVVGDALALFRGSHPAAGTYDLVVHAAAVVGGRTMIDGRPLELAAIDLELDAALWRWAQKARPGRVVYLSSSAAYPVVWQAEQFARRLSEDLIDIGNAARFLGRPDATYGLVKLVGELLALEARAEGIPVTVVRPFSGYGADQALDYPFPTFIDRAARRLDPFPIWGTGRQVRDFIHIDDVVAGMLDLAELGVDEAVNLGTGRATSFDRLAELVCTAAGYAPTFEHILDAPAGVEYRVADTTLADELLGALAPRITLEAGIAAALAARTEAPQ